MFLAFQKNDAYVTVAPKMEYQPQFGHEQMTRSEACRAWLNNKLKPNTKHVTGISVHSMNRIVIEDPLKLALKLSFFST